MPMNVITLTINPVIDKSTEAPLIMPNRKNRCTKPRFEPGGGGINVARALKKLHGSATAWYLAGGNSGNFLQMLLEDEGIDQYRFITKKEVRENLMVYDQSSSEHYRFGMPGPILEPDDWGQVMEKLGNLDSKVDYFVASGSLPPGVPYDLYAQMARVLKEKNIKMVLDTTGEPLKLALEEGVYMFKPNIHEMASLLGKETLYGMEQEGAAIQILQKGQCEMLVLSLGPRGAMMAFAGDKIQYVVPPTIPVKSTVGSGDSMVAGLLYGLVNGYPPSDAIKYGVAAGTAATMTPGSGLCRKEDTETIYKWLRSKSTG
jgi:6-phosphofructokinase 2